MDRHDQVSVLNCFVLILSKQFVILTNTVHIIKLPRQPLRRLHRSIIPHPPLREGNGHSKSLRDDVVVVF